MFLSKWTVTGAYLARRDYWQTFSKELEASDAGAARAKAMAQIGGNHHVPRARVRIDSVTGAGP
jgi:ribosomal protein L20A (L18A)